MPIQNLPGVLPHVTSPDLQGEIPQPQVRTAVASAQQVSIVAPTSAPPYPSEPQPSRTERADQFLTLKDYHEQHRDTTWCWDGVVAQGYLTLIVARPDVGKSLLALRILGSVTNGLENIDGTRWGGKSGKALFLDFEGAMSLYVDRATRMGIDHDRIQTICLAADGGSTPPITDFESKARIIELLDTGEFGIVLVDSLSGGSSVVDENTAKAGVVVKWLQDIAQHYDIPVLLVHHLRKGSWKSGSSRPTLDGVRGSSAITQYPKIIVALDKPLDDCQDVRLVVIKNNASDRRSALAYQYTNPLFRLVSLQELEERAKSTDTNGKPSVSAETLSKIEPWIRSGLPLTEVAKKSGVSRTTLYKAIRVLDQTDLDTNGSSQTQAVQGSGGQVDTGVQGGQVDTGVQGGQVDTGVPATADAVSGIDEPTRTKWDLPVYPLNVQDVVNDYNRLMLNNMV